jgi:carbamoyl-phosphate synthase large subunit
MIEMERELSAYSLATLPRESLRRAKRMGFSDAQVAGLLQSPDGPITPSQIRQRRLADQITPVYYRVDTCAAEFEAFTPYLYSTYESHDEAAPTDNRKVVILGGGPNRIGQGIEFDYCCVHACFALKELDFETIMVNCNPETVSTDYDTADRLYFEPLTLEDVLNVIDEEKPEGVIVQFGGQTPINLTRGLAEPHNRWRRPGAWQRASATRCSCGPRTSSVGARWRLPTTTTRSPNSSPQPPRPRRTVRC